MRKAVGGENGVLFYEKEKVAKTEYFSLEREGASSQKQPGVARSSQEQPGAARSREAAPNRPKGTVLSGIRQKSPALLA